MCHILGCPNSLVHSLKTAGEHSAHLSIPRREAGGFSQTTGNLPVLTIDAVATLYPLSRKHSFRNLVNLY